jgi:KTSC domain
MTWEKQVYSTMVQAIGYEAESGELIITWRNGSRGSYSGVPEDVALQAAQAASVGQFLNSEIKPIYAYRRI